MSRQSRILFWPLGFARNLLIIKALSQDNISAIKVKERKGIFKTAKYEEIVPLKCPLKRLQGSENSYKSQRNQSIVRKCYLLLVLCKFSRNKWCCCLIIEPCSILKAAASFDKVKEHFDYLKYCIALLQIMCHLLCHLLQTHCPIIGIL